VTKPPGEVASGADGRKPLPPIWGAAALERLLTVVGKGAIGSTPGEWGVGFDISRGSGSGRRGLRVLTPDKLRDVAEATMADARPQGASLLLGPFVSREVRDLVTGRPRDERAVKAVLLRLELVELFAEGGPLARATLPPAGDQRLGAPEWRQARSFALKHVEHCCFPPTLVLEDGWEWTLVYRLERGLIECPGAHAQLQRMGLQLAKFLHASRPLPPLAKLDVTRLVRASRPGGHLASILVCDERRTYDPSRVIALAERLLAAIAESNPPYIRGETRPLPPAMALRTLAPTWDLTDLRLDEIHRRAIGFEPEAIMATPRLLLEIVTDLARRGHGWLDVEQLLGDPRYVVHSALCGRETSSLKHRFREALVTRDARYPALLPFGIHRIERTPEREMGEGDRFVLVVRGAGLDQRVEVGWDTLVSAPATARAIGKVLQRVLPPPAPRVWSAVLAQGLADPRVTAAVPAEPGRATLALTDRIRRFLAQDSGHHDGPRHSRDPAGWPVLRDGVLVFPRPVLEHYLAQDGVRPRRSELTRALESMGGFSRGAMHFPGSGKIRVWCCSPPANAHPLRRTLA
jgi:hypothetical protein